MSLSYADIPRRHASRRGPCAVLVAVALVASTAPAAAGSSVVASYELTLAGLPLASFAVGAELRDNAYVIHGDMQASRVVRIVSKISGWSKSSGVLGEDGVKPEGFRLLVKWGGDRTTIRLGFNGKRVETVDVAPPPDKGPNRVPLTAKDRIGVIDPFSAVLMPIPEGELSGETACARRLPIFDGRYRYDLVLSHKRTIAAQEQGARALYVCRIKYVPLAGHKPKREQTAFWKDRDDIEIWLAPERRTGMMVPHRVVLPTPLGDALLALRGLDIKPLRQAAKLGAK